MGRRGKNGAGIDSAAQKQPDRHITDQSALDRLRQQAVELIGKILFTALEQGSVRLQRKFPIAPQGDKVGLQIEQQPVAAGQLCDSLVRRSWRRKEAVAEQFLQ